MREPVTVPEVKRMRALYAETGSVLQVARSTGRCPHTVRRYLTDESLERDKQRHRARYEADREDPRWLKIHRHRCREYKRRIRAKGGDAVVQDK